MAVSLPPPDPSQRAADPPASPVTTTGPVGRGRPAWAIPVVVAAALLLAAIVGYSLIQGLADSGGAGGGSADDDPAAWNAIAVVEPETGVITVFDAEGSELERIETDVSDPLVRSISNRELALVGDGAATLVDFGDGTTERIEVPDDLDLMVTRRGSPRPFLGTTVGGAVLVPTADGGVVDLAAEAGWPVPRILPDRAVASPSGRHLAFDNSDGDAQTAVISTTTGEVVVVAGLVLALDDDGITTQRLDADTAIIERFDLDGSSQGSVELMVRPVAVIGADDGNVIAVTSEGGIVRVDPAGGDREELGQLDIDQEVDRAFGGAGGGRAVLVFDHVADERAALHLVRDDGTVSGPIEVQRDVRQVSVGPAAGCVTLASESSTLVLRLADGAVVEQLDGDTAGAFIASVDACTAVVLDRDQRRVITPDGLVELDNVRIMALSPDGRWVAVRTGPEDGDEPTLLAAPLESFEDGALDPAAGIELPARTTVVFVQHG